MGIRSSVGEGDKGVRESNGGVRKKNTTFLLIPESRFIGRWQIVDGWVERQRDEMKAEVAYQ